MPSRGGQPKAQFSIPATPEFQFMPSRGGQPGLSNRDFSMVKFQFMPSRGGQPIIVRFPVKTNCVSIHALAWRATVNMTLRANEHEFQFMPSRGGQLKLNAVNSYDINVSIHALAWRATFCLSVILIKFLGFNSCPRVEGNLH